MSRASRTQHARGGVMSGDTLFSISSSDTTPSSDSISDSGSGSDSISASAFGNDSASGRTSTSSVRFSSSTPISDFRSRNSVGNQATRIIGGIKGRSRVREYMDQLKLDIIVSDMVFISFGWVARHLMSVRDNYFGSFTHFSTLTEYVTRRNQNVPIGDPVEWKWREGKSNVFEVVLCIQFERSAIVLPAGLPGYEYSLGPYPTTEQQHSTGFNSLGTCVIVLQPEIQLQLRTHDYSMEMSLNISPTVISIVEDVVHDLTRESYERLGRQSLQIDG
ncbi:hypothetical protein JB92DRAFT_3113412 [Gautieria morchelliformis]|nr:hypothetical protein JB92DRAFT_3113412 [Gautieria morchelliformis]